MSLISHIETLNARHERLKEKVNQAQIHHFPEEQIASLKKEKLKIKDEIIALSREMEAA